MGGTGVLIHKYLGPAAIEDGSDPTKPDLKIKAEITELDIQDVLFLENRDRVYDTTIYELIGTYNISDADFDLSQFGLFLNADTMFLTFHMNEMVERMGRRLMSGDVIELPHLNDDLLLDATAKSINKFYVVNDASRSAEGYGPTWLPHLWRIKCSPMNDAQEYRGILGDPDDEDSLKNALSTYQKEIQISNTILESAAITVPSPGYNNTTINDITNTPVIHGFDGSGSSSIEVRTAEMAASEGDTTGVASGLSFPSSPIQGELFIRADFTPERLFVYRGSLWRAVVDNTNKSWNTVTYNAGSFINNANQTTLRDADGNAIVVPERQPLSQVFTKPKPEVDN